MTSGMEHGGPGFSGSLPSFFMPNITIVIDTREQKPWTFSSTEFGIVRRGLPTGDYSLAGFEDQIAVERKSLGDLVGTLITDWIRFRKELYRMAGMDSAVIIAECNLSDIQDKLYDSDANPEAVIARCAGCYVDHGIPVVFCGDALRAGRYVERFFRLWWKRMGGK